MSNQAQSREPHTQSVPQSSADHSWWKQFAAAICVAVIAAVAATASVNRTDGAFKIPAELGDRASEVHAVSLPPDLQAEVDVANYRVRVYTTMAAFGLLGSIFAGCYGFGIGASQRSLVSGIRGAAVGVVLGILLGSLGGLAGQLIDETFHVRDTMDSFIAVVMMHSASLLFVAVAVAVAVSVGRGDRTKMLAGVLSSMVVVVIASMLFLLIAPMVSIQRTNLPVPEGNSNRLVWTSLLAGLLALTFYRSRRSLESRNDSATLPRPGEPSLEQ